MKSERRHELKQNELADYLAKSIERIKPYQNAILGVILLTVVGVWLGVWWSRKSEAKTADAWNSFYRTLFSPGTRPEDFDELIERHPNTRLADWAQTIAADAFLASGCGNLFVDRAEANEELRQAVDRYTKLLEQTEEPTLRERATFGLARAREAQGKLDLAIEHYGEMDQKWPDGAYATEARRRLEDLKRPATEKFYANFADFNPRPAAAFIDEPGVPGERPSFDLDSIPDSPFSRDLSPLDSPPDSTKEELGPGLDTEDTSPKETSEPPSEDTAEPATPEPTIPEPTTPESATPEPTAPEPTTPEAATPEAATPEAATPEATTPEPATPEPAADQPPAPAEKAP